jgi:hypothetical protein
MPAAALPYIAVVAAVGSLGYGIYAGQQAQKAQATAIAQANQNAQNAQSQQASQYQQQLTAEQQTTAQNLATEAQTKADTQAAQQTALAAEQAAIGTNSTTLSNSLSGQESQALKAQQPLIQDQLNQGGLSDSGAYAAQLAKYQAGLASQAQTTLANYQVGAQGQLTQDTNAASASQVQMDQSNALLNIQNGEQNMAQNFATQNNNNNNNTAYQQYITSLQAAQAQSQAQQAAGYTQLGGAIGGAALNYYGQQNNPALAAMYQQNPNTMFNAGYGAGPNQGLGPSWNGGTINGSGFAG